jgi:hypothetical protein
MRPDELERRLRERLDALDPLSRHGLLSLLETPDAAERAEFARKSLIMSELLVESEEDPTVRAVLLAMCPADRSEPPP